MEPTEEQGMRRLAERAVGEPFVAAALFHNLAEVELQGAFVGALVAIGQWAWIKKRSRLPS